MDPMKLRRLPMLTDNPVTKRYFFSTLRPRHIWIYSFIYFTLISLVLLINFIAMEFEVTDVENAKILYTEFVMLQVLILWFMAGYNTSSAIRDEILHKTYDFFKLIPIPSHQKATGIFIGKNSVPFLMATINLIFMVVFGSLGQLSAGYQAKILFLLVSGTVFFNAAGLLSSAVLARFRRNSSPAYLIFLYLFLTPYVIFPIAFVMDNKAEPDVILTFFSVPVSIITFLSLIALYFTGWLFKGILIKIDRDTDPLFDRKGACLFLVGYIIIVLGIMQGQIPVKSINFGYAFWGLSSIPLFLIPFGAKKSFMHYMEISSKLNMTCDRTNGGTVQLLMVSNLRTWLELFMIWAGFAAGIGLLSGIDTPHILHHILAGFLFWTVLALLVELSVLLAPDYEKIKYLLIFIAFLVVILPMVFGGIIGQRFIVNYSLFGYLAEFAENTGTQFYIHGGIFGMNILLAGIILAVIWNRYTWIMRVRNQM